MEITFDLKDFVLKTKSALFSPKLLFEKVADEKDWRTALSYSIAISIVASIFGIIQSILLFPLIKDSLPSDFQKIQTPTLVEALPAFLLSTIFIVLLTFVWSFFLHNWLKLFRVKGNYWSSYKAYVYSRAPLSILGWIPIIGPLSGLYTVYVLVVGISKLNKITIKRSLLLVTPLVLIMIIMQFLLSQLL